MAAVTVFACIFILLNHLVVAGNITYPRRVIYNNYNMKPSGCQDKIDEINISLCAFRASSNYEPFKYSNGECQNCPGDQVTNLTFGSDLFYFPRSHILSSQAATHANPAVIYLSQPLTPGTVIYLAVTPLADVNLFELKSNTDITFHMFIRFNYGHMGMNTYYQGVWGAEAKYPTTEPFVKGQRTDAHFLLTLDRFVVYFNKVFFCEYKYRLAISDVELVHVVGDSLVHELYL